MKRQRNAGYSLIELLIAISLFGAIGGSTLFMGRASEGLASQSQSLAQLDRQLNVTFDRIVKGLRTAMLSSLMPAAVAGSPTLTFQVPRGFSAGSVVLGPAQVFRWEAAADDPIDGIDNNGDGTIDECQVVWLADESAPNRALELCSVVAPWLAGETPNGLDDNGNGLIDEPGLCFAIDGSVLTIRMSVQAVSADGVTFTRSREARVNLRNP